MDNGFQVLLFVVFCFVVIASIRWHFSRSRSVLEQWADEHGFEIVHSEYRHLARGPFFWTTSKGQAVYYVRVRNSKGTERLGWVRCGGWFFGLMTDKAEVRWEDEL
jgi:hypothetical protein